MKCFHEYCLPELAIGTGSQAEACFCGDGDGALRLENFSASSPLESIVETSLRRGLVEELEAMGLTLTWDHGSQTWQTTAHDEEQWVRTARGPRRETRH